MRRTSPESTGSRKKVSCICRAGWSGPRLRASKLSHSLSSSGPSATSQPIPTKASTSRWADELDGVAGAEAARRRRDRDVDPLLDEDPLVALGLELGLARGERRADPPPRLADTLAGLGLGARRQRPDLAVGEREGALLALVGSMRAALSSSSELAAATAASASSTAVSICAGSSAATSTGS